MGMQVSISSTTYKFDKLVALASGSCHGLSTDRTAAENHLGLQRSKAILCSKTALRARIGGDT